MEETGRTAGTATTTGSRRTEKPDIPRYCMPNFSSVLPSYTNNDAEYIARAFRGGNFVNISRLPSTLKPHAVSKARNDQATVNLRNSAPTVKGQTAKKGLFMEFEYMPSRYSLADELATKERLQDEAKRLAIGGRDWVCASNNKKLKHEDGFEDKEYRYPYLGDPYAAAQDQVQRAKWVQDSKILHGPFMPSGSSKLGTEPTRQMLPKILNELYEIIDEDWGEYKFSVLSTEDDAIVVRFELDSIDSERGLHAYMNVMCRNGEIVNKYLLKKVVEDWHSQPGDGYLYYMFRPPWVRGRTTDAFFTLHPEERAYATSLAATLKPERATSSMRSESKASSVR